MQFLKTILIAKEGSRQLILTQRLMSLVGKKLKYNEFGEPVDVLKLIDEPVEEPKDDEVVVKILAAPINPADINTIQGKYPVKPVFPAVGGNECVAEVLEVGCQVKSLKKGDRVVPNVTGIGTWAEYSVYKAEQLMRISSDLSIPEAATITVNPPTAYRMLKDFVHLKPGDTVIQNGANSAVGQQVHQLCKIWDVSSVGIVRNRSNICELKDFLKNLGATEVFTEEEIRKTTIFKNELKKPKLALNCVGGKNATEMSRHLDHGGVMVTYGGMSREPVTASTAALIFKDLSFQGFWMTRWTKENFKSSEREAMFAELFSYIKACKLTASTYEMVPFKNYKKAIEGALNFKGFTGKKFILDMQGC